MTPQETLPEGPRWPAWRACVATFVLAIAIIGGLLAMHTITVDHAMHSPAYGRTQAAHPSHAVAVGGEDDTLILLSISRV